MFYANIANCFGVWKSWMCNYIFITFLINTKLLSSLDMSSFVNVTNL